MSAKALKYSMVQHKSMTCFSSRCDFNAAMNSRRGTPCCRSCGKGKETLQSSGSCSSNLHFAFCADACMFLRRMRVLLERGCICKAIYSITNAWSLHSWMRQCKNERMPNWNSDIEIGHHSISFRPIPMWQCHRHRRASLTGLCGKLLGTRTWIRTIIDYQAWVFASSRTSATTSLAAEQECQLEPHDNEIIEYTDQSWQSKAHLTYNEGFE